ncbi:hypothetical protein Sste5346_002270 [Sporothrix stenoceras]|uniref:Kinesin light chain n=1 Tax=Sporothrix stenoceras TaxID=5173 RepID=A0ABR3ZJZ4_9PEZI
MLPDKFTHARLLTFGYDADVVRGDVASKDTIKSLAGSLLYSLKRDREEASALHRPIVFVVHSLGGIVCKKAIALSQQRSADEKLGALVNSLIGIIFMGTPHNGSRFADAAGLLVSSFKWFKSANENLLKALAKDNQIATDIDNEFWDACDIVGKASNQRVETLLFDDACRVVALYGLGGVGKTQVANELAHWTKENKPDYSVLWVPALSKSGFEKAYESISIKLGIQRLPNQDVKEVVRDYLSSDGAGNWLLVVDNADDPDLICGRDVPDCLDQYLPQNDNGRILVTTRTMFVSQSLADETVSLDEFDLSQAKELTTKLLKRQRPSSQDDEASLDELLKELVYLPLAITQAMAFLSQTGLSVKKYLELLRCTEADRLDLLGKESPDKTRLVHMAARSWFQKNSRIEETARTALQHVVSIFPDEDYENRAYHANGQIQEAVDLLEHVVKVKEKLAEDHPDRLTSQHALAWAYHANGQIPKAVDLLEHVVKVREKLAEDHPHRLASQHELAVVYRTSGHIQEAVNLLEHVVKVQEKLAEDHPHRLASQHALAGAYHASGQIQKAVDLLEHVVKVKEKLAEDHPDRLASQHALAMVYHTNGQIQEAVDLLEYVVKVQEKLAEDHPDRLASQHALAIVYHANGQIQEAVDLLEHVVKVQEKLAEDHPDRLFMEESFHA